MVTVQIMCHVPYYHDITSMSFFPWQSASSPGGRGIPGKHSSSKRQTAFVVAAEVGLGAYRHYKKSLF
jgi:hypothetical protein